MPKVRRHFKHNSVVISLLLVFLQFWLMACFVFSDRHGAGCEAQQECTTVNEEQCATKHVRMCLAEEENELITSAPIGA